MQMQSMIALASQGFRGIQGLSLNTSIREKDFAYKKGGEYTHFVYAADAPNKGFALGIIDSEKTRESEFFWVTQEQWHKIARHNLITLETLWEAKVQDLVYFVYEYMGAEPIFGKPSETFIIEVNDED